MKKELNALTRNLKNLLRELCLEMRGSDGLLISQEARTCPVAILWKPPSHDRKPKGLADAEQMIPKIHAVFEHVGLNPDAIKIRAVKDPRLPRRARYEANLWNFTGHIDAAALRDLARS